MLLKLGKVIRPKNLREFTSTGQPLLKTEISLRCLMLHGVTLYFPRLGPY
jgi:hypothetical protein